MDKLKKAIEIRDKLKSIYEKKEGKNQVDNSDEEKFKI